MKYTREKHIIFKMLEELGYDSHQVKRFTVDPEFITITLKNGDDGTGAEITYKNNLNFGEKY